MSIATVHVVVNGEPIELRGSVSDLLVSRGIDPQRAGVAVAINDRVVRRHDWDLTVLEEGDRIEVITAMQGG